MKNSTQAVIRAQNWTQHPGAVSHQCYSLFQKNRNIAVQITPLNICVYCMCVRLKSRHSYAEFLELEQVLMHYIWANESSTVLGKRFWTLRDASACYHVRWNSVKLMTGNQRNHWKSLGIVMRCEIACVSQKSGKQSQDLIINVYVTHHSL